jgi:hypothetical protein
MESYWIPSSSEEKASRASTAALALALQGSRGSGDRRLRGGAWRPWRCRGRLKGPVQTVGRRGRCAASSAPPGPCSTTRTATPLRARPAVAASAAGRADAEGGCLRWKNRVGIQSDGHVKLEHGQR